jgi:hypothetical protein
MRPTWGIPIWLRSWSRPAIAIVLGLGVLSLASVDYITSPAQHKGLYAGPLIFQFPGQNNPMAIGQRRGHGGRTPATAGGGAATPATTTGGTRPAISANGLKYPLIGLLDRQGAPSPAFYSVLSGYVVNVSWASLQISPGGPITSNNAIDRAIAQVRSANAAGAHLALKLRVWTGIQAPGWAKNIGGAPIAVRDPNSNASGTVGHYWSPAYEAAYANLQARLAALYDGVPEIREVSIVGCMTIYDEPFLRQANDPATVANLRAAGFTVAADMACQRAQIVAHAAWKLTYGELAFNPYQEILPSSTTTSESFTATMISYCRATLGPRCILQNNSLRVVSMGTAYDAMYASIKAAGPHIAFQTAIMSKVGSLSGTLSKAVSLYAEAVELPFGYQSMGAAAFAGFAARLATNVGS